jgi:hypothetical protein
MKHVSRRPTQEYLRTVLATSTVLPPMMVGSSRALVRTKNEIKKLPWNMDKQVMSEYEGKLYPLHGKRTRANQEKMRLNVW